MNKKFTVIDLFSGCGGLSEGFMQTEKFEFVAHVEWELPMINTLRENLTARWNYTKEHSEESVIRFDIQKTEELMHGNWTNETRKQYISDNAAFVADHGIDGLLQGKKVDVIIGGPPCQAYSIAGRAQDSNSMRNDYRNYLFESFVKVVDCYKPEVFVFENVPGILSATPGGKHVIDRICEAFNEIGYDIRSPFAMNKSIYSANDFEVPQQRRRIIIFGVRKGASFGVEELYKNLDLEKCTDKKLTVADAIKGLPKYRPISKPYKVGARNYSYELVGNVNLPYHVARYNNKRDIDVFKKWLEGDMNQLPNQDKLEFYQQVSGKKTNHNKYRSLEWDKPSPTIVSHLYKDGLMFIHPDKEQLRTITVLEASLLQSFPKEYRFIGSTAYCY
ncbi:MAG: DNA cytosine methyltransferase, partial [Bacteroidales bacterium]